MAQRLLRRQVVLIALALAVIVGGACGSRRGAVPTGATGTGSAGVRVVTPSPADLAALATAWEDWQHFSSFRPTCSVQVTPSSVKEAYVASTNLWWAIATVAPTTPIASFMQARPSPSLGSSSVSPQCSKRGTRATRHTCLPARAGG